MKKFASLFLLFIVVMAAVPKAQAQTLAAASEAAAAQRAKELANLINSGNRTEAKKYIADNYAQSFMRIPLDNHLNFISNLHDVTRGLEFHSLQESKAAEVTALFKSKLTGAWVALIVRVESAEPYKITGIGRRPPKPPAEAKATKRLTDTQIAQELDAFLNKLTEADVFSGSVLLAKDGRVLYKKAFGIANKDFNVPNRVDTKFNLGSMNKMFTSVAIAQLVERGKLSFDDPLAKFLPEFPSKEAAEKIKIKHLLTHTSGLGSYFNDKFFESSRANFRTVDDMMKLAKDEKLQFEPGSRWSYSNTGMLVLGAVIEKVTGQSYFDYIRENIYKPAGMTNSDCYELDRINANLAVGYDKEFTDNGYQFRNNIFLHVMRGGPAGGGYSTVEDLLKFDIALRSNKLVGADSVKLLTSAKPEVNSPEYGYGFGVDTENQVVGHSGGFPGISSILEMYLASGYTVAIMSNYGSGMGPVNNKLREMLLAGQDTRAANR